MQDKNHIPIPANQHLQHNQAPRYACQHCDKSLTTKQCLSVHIKIIYPEVIKTPHQCHVCQKLLEFPSKLKRHLQHAHSKDRPHNCPKCEISCKSESNLKCHLKIHAENREKFKCSICGKDYFWKCDLNRHWNEGHVGVNYKSNTESDKSQDNNEKGSVNIPHHQQRNQPVPYPCQHCDKSFATQSGLSRHMKFVHPEVIQPPHQCRVCQKVFSYPSGLTQHAWYAHSEYSPYGCPQCTVRCKSQSNLNKHLKLHRENRERYNCSICGKEYATSSGLKLHLKTKHGRLINEGKAERDSSGDEGDTGKLEDHQSDASGGKAETAPENIPTTVSQYVQNGVVTVDYPSPTWVGCKGLETREDEFVVVMWKCNCGNLYASEDDVRKHRDQDH